MAITIDVKSNFHAARSFTSRICRDGFLIQGEKSKLTFAINVYGERYRTVYTCTKALYQVLLLRTIL